jgi:tetratricopeptide (TPR) repeat protein
MPKAISAVSSSLLLSTIQTPAVGANSNSYLVSGIQYYNAKDYNKAIVLFKRAVEADSTNQMAWNNIIATYNTLQMYEDAIAVADKGIKRFPTYDIMKNNRKISVDGLSKLKVSEAYYSSISYNYFAQADYANCVKASIMLLKYNPKSVTAYNNMCASYNALGKFQLGKEACEKGLQLDH